MNEHKLVGILLSKINQTIERVLLRTNLDDTYYRYKVVIEKLDNKLEYVLERWTWDNFERKIQTEEVTEERC